MCWVHEDKYPGRCSDIVFYNFYNEDFLGFLQWLEKEMGIDSIDDGTMQKEFYNLLTSWHDRKIIKPVKEIENDK